MNQPYKTFIFSGYSFDTLTKRADFTYQFDDSLTCTESYIFDFEYVDYNPNALDTALQLLFFLAGVSYYKMYVPPNIVIRSGNVDPDLSDFLSETYQKGLGEFFYTNQLDPNHKINFIPTSPAPKPLLLQSNGSLVALGGGKDSLVSVELLRSKGQDFCTWNVGHSNQLAPLINRIDKPNYYVQRTIDPYLSSLNDSGALNGHVPVSAIYAAVGTAVAILTGKRDIVLSNEQSANDPSLTYKEVLINHQYSKSQMFESSYQHILTRRFGDSIRYFSLLRPYTELRIAELFAKIAFEKYKDVFSSCNRAFRQGESKLFWCGKCSKCAFTFLALTPFVIQSELERVYGGKNLLSDPNLEQTYRQLLGIEGDKPLDCVGTIAESRVAMRLAQSIYPNLSHYTFNLEDTYDFRKQYPNLIPIDLQNVINNSMK